MRAWREREPTPASTPSRDGQAGAAIEDAPAIDLDPARPRPTRHGDDDARATTRTRTPAREPGEPPVIGIVGAGAVGTALGVALTRGRLADHRGRQPRPRPARAVPELVPGARAFAEADALLDEVELIILAVPDDAIAPLAGELRHVQRSGDDPHERRCWAPRSSRRRWRPGPRSASFHPLVAFADTERAVAALHGATIAVEGDDQLVALLGRHGRGDRATPVRLAPGPRRPITPPRSWRPAASSPCSTRSPSWAGWPGLDEAGALAVYVPLIRADPRQRPGARASEAP